jgi:hypothetical protein
MKALVVIYPEFFMWMGPFKWLLILLLVLVIALVIKKALELGLPGISQERKSSGVNAILFWGIIAMAMGIFSQTVSLWAALQEIIKADDISPAIVLIGFYGSFVAPLFGTATLILAALAWWLFRYLLNKPAKR